jgi:hypothetical protein
VRVKVETTEDPGQFSAITFRIGDNEVEVTGLTPSPTAEGFNVDLTVPAANLNIATGRRQWELLATFGGEVRTLAEGPFNLNPEPTS